MGKMGEVCACTRLAPRVKCRSIGVLLPALILLACSAVSAQGLTRPLPPVRTPWCWQVLPDGPIYRSYMAGVKEPRLGIAWLYERKQGWMWDAVLGGRVGILRYGTHDDIRPEGWQADLEGAAMPRLDPEELQDLTSVDFRVGVPITYGCGPHQTKFAFYHVSAHLGDEFMMKNPTVPRINFSRDALVLGHSYYWTDELRLYGEASWAFHTDGGNERWEFQFGLEYSSAHPTGCRPVPFYAINGHVREELDFGGSVSLQTGLLWRGPSGHVFRVGMQYFAGASEQYEFYYSYEEKLGFGVWYDY